MKSTVTSYLEKRWLQHAVLVLLMVVVLCWDRGFIDGLTMTAHVLYVVALCIIASSAVLAIAWHQHFLTPSVIAAIVAVILYTAIALIYDARPVLTILSLSGLGSGVVIGTAVALGMHLWGGNDEA